MNKKKRKYALFSERYFNGPKYLEVKARAMKYLMIRTGGNELWISRTSLRDELKLHAYVVDRLMDEFNKEGRISVMKTTSGLFYKWI